MARCAAPCCAICAKRRLTAARTASCGWILPRAWAPIATPFAGASRCAEVREAIAEFRRVAREGSTAEALAAFYAYESQVPRVAKEKADGLAQRYGADAKTCGYFQLHQFADVEHAEVWRSLLSAEIAADPQQAEAALTAAERAAQSLWHVLDGMEARRTADGPWVEHGLQAGVRRRIPTSYSRHDHRTMIVAAILVLCLLDAVLKGRSTNHARSKACFRCSSSSA